MLLRINTEKDTTKSDVIYECPQKTGPNAKPHRKQSIKIGVECQGLRQPLPLKRSYSANSEVRSHSTTSLCPRQSLSETHRVNKSLQEKATNQCRLVSASEAKKQGKVDFLIAISNY